MKVNLQIDEVSARGTLKYAPVFFLDLWFSIGCKLTQQHN